MNNPDNRIPEDIAEEVLKVASRLYTEKTQGSYSLEELQAAGKEVQIPPELIEEAIRQVQEKRRQEAIRKQQVALKQKRLMLIGGGVAIAIALWGIFTYNSLSSSNQTVKAAWAQVENQLQRRADLIPNLVNVTKSYAAHEEKIITQLTQAREAYLQADSVAAKTQATTEINQAIQAFNQYAINNNQLKSSEVFTNLQYELAGTENRIATERMRYNQAVQVYNHQVESFPNSLIAGLTGFNAQPYFQANNI